MSYNCKLYGLTANFADIVEKKRGEKRLKYQINLRFITFCILSILFPKCDLTTQPLKFHELAAWILRFEDESSAIDNRNVPVFLYLYYIPTWSLSSLWNTHSIYYINLCFCTQVILFVLFIVLNIHFLILFSFPRTQSLICLVSNVLFYTKDWLIIKMYINAILFRLIWGGKKEKGETITISKTSRETFSSNIVPVESGRRGGWQTVWAFVYTIKPWQGSCEGEAGRFSTKCPICYWGENK